MATAKKPGTQAKAGKPGPGLLAEYNARRDFTRTAEPAGEAAPDGGNLFMVQKHDATRLHWDLRLELDGVLKSWAVTKGPSPNPDDKRLAVRTEDHPLSYATFEGTIPASEYGGGTVMLWDQGSWTPVPGKDPRKTIEEGHLHFTLDGERMKGEWLLVRMKGKPKEKRENWLLRKVDDEFSGSSDDLVGKALTSVASGRTMAQIADGRPPAKTAAAAAKGKAASAAKSAAKDSGAGTNKAPGKTAAKSATKTTTETTTKTATKSKGRTKGSGKGGVPPFQAPQLATLVDHVPEGPEWIHEVKYDGYRCLIAANGPDVKAYTRSGQDWSDRFAPIVDAIRALDLPECLIDGELVALDKEGRPSFRQLQASIKDGGGKMALFAFDLLREGDEDLTGLPNLERKQRLQALLEDAADPIHYAEHLRQGAKLFETLCREGYEGVISKRADAPYRGQRTRSWLKIKCTLRQEFIILGWTDSDKTRGFRSLLLGARVDGRIHYAGKVGTGFSMDLMQDLLERMRKLRREGPAAEDVPRAAMRGSHWIEPALLAEVAYTETTAPLGQGGVLRHPSFLGLREDKPVEDVTVEAAEPAPKKKKDRPKDEGLFGIKITNPDRVIFPESGFTKQELAAYYAAMADPILRFAANRPMSLVRCPQGRAKQCFFQKHDAGSFGEHVHHVPIVEKKGESADYLYVSDGAGLVSCVQMGGIEFHGWGSTVDAIEYPDRLVFDLDPDPGVSFDQVKKAAVHLKDELAALGLATEPMLTGGKGIHLVAMLDQTADWPTVKDFASRLARAMAEARPDMFTANMKKVERKGRIFLDWLRNQRGATAVMPWTVRARPGAPVAVPVHWSELDEFDGAAVFNISQVDALLARADRRDLRGWGTDKQTLPAV